MAVTHSQRAEAGDAAPSPQTALPARRTRTGAAAVWATVGLVWAIVSTQAILRWVASDSQFKPVTPKGPDVYPGWREAWLRVLEVASTGVLLAFVWFCVVRPLLRDGKLSFDGKLVIGGVFASVADAYLNTFNYLFAWNAHSIDRGVWTSFLPFHHEGASSRYAEGAVWGTPMYIYFCTGAAIVGCKVVRTLRERYPTISNPAAFSVVFASEFVAGCLLENLIIRTTQAYGYAQTNASLTLFDGKWYQYPIYESLFTATMGVAFTYVRLTALESSDGVSCVERGYERWKPQFQGAIRLFAVIGFYIFALIMMYHLPFNWLGVTGDSMAHLPSYMLPN